MAVDWIARPVNDAREGEMTLGKRIGDLRRDRGWTQQQLADAVGVSVRTLQSWEIDQREPGWRHFLHLALALGREPAEFLSCSYPEGK
jgi:transcriptional regulator with XRE-family HTH domain